MRVRFVSGARVGCKLRLAAARIWLRLGARRREIGRLFSRTAAAFGSPVPTSRRASAKGLLAEYALFTREHAEAALDNGEDLSALDSRLFQEAFVLGSGYRLRLGVRTFRDAMAAARLIYGGLGIDFRANPDGEVAVRRCGFAKVYTPRVCTLISALDQGLIAGLTDGGKLKFRQRLTEGAPACRACVSGGRP
jgi:hypothetical protein